MRPCRPRETKGMKEGFRVTPASGTVERVRSRDFTLQARTSVSPAAPRSAHAPAPTFGCSDRVLSHTLNCTYSVRVRVAAECPRPRLRPRRIPAVEGGAPAGHGARDAAPADQAPLPCQPGILHHAVQESATTC